ncbi:MAG: DUF6273 domain-containing protein [Coriobacteriales bacterium]|nr:DUF6273 domain-containing protein [Coriobacteriales bacterium]
MSDAEAPSLPLADTQVGDTITFGNYGNQAMEWRVLAIEDGKALVITRDIIDQRVYNEEKAQTTWEQCTLRQWLNADFYNSAFSDLERSYIIRSNVQNNDNPDYGTTGGADTEDYVFLLSIEEVYTYFDSELNVYRNTYEDRIAVQNMSPELIEDAAQRIDENPYTGDYYTYSEALESLELRNGEAEWWLLRSPGDDAGHVAGVDPGGFGGRDGGNIDPGGYTHAINGIRPAMWLKLTS